jgi:hypothetical protein
VNRARFPRVEPAFRGLAPWYVPPALEGRRAHGWRAFRGPGAGALAGLAAFALGACGGEPRQDKGERERTFRVEVVRATFPGKQKLAKSTDLVIKVRNAGSETIPNIAVTLKGFDRRLHDPELADPGRPSFVINGRPKTVGGYPESKEAAPVGGETAYVNTWALGKLKPGAERTFRWTVTAVAAGPYRIKYTVAAGLGGKAKAVDGSGNRPTGLFVGNISDAPPNTRVADDGKTVIRGTR